MLKILYDYQIFTCQRVGGISRYFVELMSNLPEEFKTRQTALLTDNVYLKEYLSSNESKSFSISNFKGKGRIYTWLNKFNTMKMLKFSQYDIFHPTYYNPYFLKMNKRPYVITVYDMIHEKFADMFTATDPTREYKRKTILGADKIIAISNQTKNDLIELYGIEESKISVVYLGHSVDTNEISVINGLPKNYILFVGVRHKYKNFMRFIQSFAVLTTKYSDLHLVCTGHSFTKEEQEVIHQLHLTDKVHQYFVSDAQLNYLYQNAKCFVFPSLYEGFGIPILEAFASSCPIALSDTSCFPEIAQEGGCYFNPYDIDSMSDAISKLIFDTEYREKQIENGLKVLKQFSWKKMAIETAAIYKSI